MRATDDVGHGTGTVKHGTATLRNGMAERSEPAATDPSLRYA